MCHMLGCMYMTVMPFVIVTQLGHTSKRHESCFVLCLAGLLVNCESFISLNLGRRVASLPLSKGF